MESSYLFVINSMGSGGAERVTSQLANYFSSKGIRVSILKLLADDSFYQLSDKIEVISAVRARKTAKNYLFWVNDIAETIIRVGATSVIAVGYRFGLLAALAISRCKRKPRLVIKLTGDRKPTFVERSLFLILKKYISVIAAQKLEQVPLFSKFCENIQVVPNPFKTHPSNMNANGYDSKRFVAVGRFAKQKRFDLLIQAFSEFSQIYQGYRLDIFGNQEADPEETKRLETLVADLHMENIVFFHSPSSSIHKLIVNSLAFVCTSDSEGLPNAFIEAMLLGLPIITTNWTGVEEMVRDGKDGYIVQLGDKSSLVAALSKMGTNSHQFWNAMSTNSYEFSSNKFSEDNTFPLWQRAIEG